MPNQVCASGCTESFPGFAVKFRFVVQEPGALYSLGAVGAGNVNGLGRFRIAFFNPCLSALSVVV